MKSLSDRKSLAVLHLFVLLLVSGSLDAVTEASAAELGIRPGPPAQLIVTGELGSTQQIEFAEELTADTDWKLLTNVVLASSPTSIEVPALEPGRFYRLLSPAAAITDPPFATPINMVWLKPGSFLMGSPDDDPDHFDIETPQTRVTFENGFWIGRDEVTQLSFQEVTGFNPSADRHDLNLPVESVTWSDATSYCTLLTEAERAAGRLPAGFAYRLPTEAEWEYAARAGSASRFSFGTDLSYSSLDRYAWTSRNSPDGSHPAGQKLLNAWGLADIYGNVSEWCLDWFGWYTPEDKIHPQGPPSGTSRVYRGGSWADSPQDARAAARGGLNPNSRLSSLGFRVVLARE